MEDNNHEQRFCEGEQTKDPPTQVGYWPWTQSMCCTRGETGGVGYKCRLYEYRCRKDSRHGNGSMWKFSSDASIFSGK